MEQLTIENVSCGKKGCQTLISMTQAAHTMSKFNSMSAKYCKAHEAEEDEIRKSLKVK